MIVRILLATIRDDIKRHIRFSFKEGNIINVVNDTESCFQQATKFSPHLIIIHEDLPFISSMDIMSKIRVDNQYNFIRIIVVTETDDAVFFSDCLDNGADDVIFLPISSDVLQNRAMAVLRRSDLNKPKELLFENLTIAPERYSVRINDNEFHFPKKEFQLLYLLASAPGKVFSRSEILETIWEAGVLVNDRTIDVHIRKIRQKLNVQCIVSVKSVGYKFILNSI